MVQMACPQQQTAARATSSKQLGLRERLVSLTYGCVALRQRTSLNDFGAAAPCSSIASTALYYLVPVFSLYHPHQRAAFWKPAAAWQKWRRGSSSALQRTLLLHWAWQTGRRVAERVPEQQRIHPTPLAEATIFFRHHGRHHRVRSPQRSAQACTARPARSLGSVSSQRVDGDEDFVLPRITRDERAWRAERQLTTSTSVRPSVTLSHNNPASTSLHTAHTHHFSARPPARRCRLTLRAGVRHGRRASAPALPAAACPRGIC